MNIAPGWYLDPEDSAGERERYWTGEEFRPGARTRGPKTPAFPEPPPPRPRISNTGLSAAYSWMVFLAAMTVIGAASGAIILAVHTGKNCTTNPYDPALASCSTTHPYAYTAIGVAVAGLSQAILLGVVASLCRHVARLRDFVTQLD